MLTYIIGVIIALLILAGGELLKNETKKVYVDNGYSWSKVIFYSNFLAIIMAFIMILILEYTNLSKDYNPYLLPFAVTMTAYITVQSFMTDLKVFMINRQILRVSYVSMYIISIYNVIENNLFKSNWIALALFTGVLILIFIFSSIGASDVRAMAVALPFVISIGGYDAIVMFLITLLLVSLGMGIRNIIRDKKKMKELKENNLELYGEMSKVEFYMIARQVIRTQKTIEEMQMAVGPYMISPFLIFLFIYPFLN